MRPLLTALFLFACLYPFCQESPYQKFGKISPEELQKKIYAVDSSAPAVVLSDVGYTDVEGNNKGWFSTRFFRHKVVHVLSKPGYKYADIEIPLYSKGSEVERLDDIKAVTYNWDGTKIIQTKLEKSNIFREKKSDNLVLVKFTMPNVKEGSIIEIEYKVVSDFYSQIDPWIFQHDVPALWSEYDFTVPQFFTYTFLSHGYHPFFINNKKEATGFFTVMESNNAGPTQHASFNSGITTYRWVQKDVPAIKEESYTSSLENYISKIEFQLTSQNQPLSPHDFRNTWPKLTKELSESEYFGYNLNSANGWLGDEMKAMVSNAYSDGEKAKKIYCYVRDNFTCTRHTGISAETSLKSIFKARKGNVAEINLLLTAMLRYAKLDANPILLSRTSHGYTFEMYPALSRFNYTITGLTIGDKTIYLDASQAHLGFGKLLPDCYNGHARVVNEEATPVYFVADSLRERKVTVLFLNKGEKTLWEGSMNQNPGYMESYELRNRIQEKGKDEFFKGIQKDFGGDVNISGGQIDSLSNYDEPIAIKYQLSYNPEKDDLLYINPMFGEGYKKNPFTSAQRAYPVEMPYATDETYIMNMEVPDGYVVDELPKQIVAKYDEEGTSFFEYRIQLSDNTISLRSRIKLARAYYEPDEYEILREFFGMIVKKHAEQIVFKKKK